MTLAEELSKTEYQGLTNAERFELVKSKLVATVGKIAYGNTLHLVSMLARGLRSMFARSSTGDNSGDLMPSAPSAALQAYGVPTAPSAQISVYRSRDYLYFD